MYGVNCRKICGGGPRDTTKVNVSHRRLLPQRVSRGCSLLEHASGHPKAKEKCLPVTQPSVEAFARPQNRGLLPENRAKSRIAAFVTNIRSFGPGTSAQTSVPEPFQIQASSLGIQRSLAHGDAATMKAFVIEIGVTLGNVAPYLLLGLMVAGLLHALVPRSLLSRAMGGEGLGPVCRASLLGIPLPLCSCSVIPVAIELRRQGAGRGPTAAFMVSTPETGVDSISSSVAVLHPLLVVFRPIAAMITAIATGLAIEKFAPEDPETSTDKDGCCGHDASDQVSGQSRGLFGGLRYAFDDVLGEITPYLLPALLVTAALGVLLEPASLANLGVAPWLQSLIVLTAGIPIYVCATAATPVAAAMIVAGISPGATLIFLLAGPATNLITISAVRQNLGSKAAIWYVSVVAVLSYTFGLILDFVWTMPDFHAESAAHLHDQHSLGMIHWFASGLLGLLMIWHIGRKARRKMVKTS